MCLEKVFILPYLEIIPFPIECIPMLSPPLIECIPMLSPSLIECIPILRQLLL